MTGQGHSTDRRARAGARPVWTAVLAAAVLVTTGCMPLASDEGPGWHGSVAPVVDGVDAGGWAVTAWRIGDGDAERIASATSGADGGFRLDVSESDAEGVVLVEATPAGGLRPLLAAVTVAAAPEGTVTLNERTTVAAGYGLAQFFGDALPSGPEPGLPNAAAMAANLADPAGGGYGATLTSSPNGSETSTLAAFTSLANILGACLTDDLVCQRLDEAIADDAVSAAAQFAAIARDPSASADELFDLAITDASDRPGLSDAPAAWTLPLRFDGGGGLLAGPGNFAIDPEGHVWVNNNYEFDADPKAPVCGSDEVFEFAANGELLATYAGGGLSGSGYGIDFAPGGDVWLSNFGFAAPAPGCPEDEQPPHDSMSLFTPDGEALSPDTGYTQGGLSWPQGIEVTGDGDVWIANCGNDTVAVYRGGDPDEAENLGGFGLQQPFDVVDNGQALFITGTVNSAVAVVDPDGTPRAGSPLSGWFDRPMGVASDADGNVWVANSGGITLPCPERTEEGRGTPSVALLSPDGSEVTGPFTGGGVTLPWGIATDGDGNVWVANFEGQRLSAFCGADAATCPRGLTTGEPISPDDQGYFFDGFTRSTGVAVDPSGNVWVTNNWEEIPLPTNPGGHQIVAFVGAAAPVAVAPFS
ncbi:NHL repeat-containing protein [Microbacterium sp. RD1]|uniref:NHL repeat-containing protein n=1 Tax=Microbacterium sp. RD1 TaxID=3457313 RepID=UPI003FA58FA8